MAACCLFAVAAHAQLNYTVQTACHPDDVKGYDTERLRRAFLMEKVMSPDEINLTYTLYDRLIYGGVMPVNQVLKLETFDELKAEHFLDRRELGVINIGGNGVVNVDGVEYPLNFKEALYVGCGKKEVTFRSLDTACPAKFYYTAVKGLQTEDEVSESLDYGMFGTVYHDTMRALYTSEEAMDPGFEFNDREPRGGLAGEALTKISRSYIESWIGRKDQIKRKVKALIMSQLNTIEVSGRNLVVADVIVRYVVKTLQRDLELLKKEGREAFEILGREIRVGGVFCGQKFKGFIDRLDSFHDGEARVVDYKTGKVLEDDENINDANAEDIADKIFHPDMKNWPKIALQFYIYDMLVQSRPEVRGREICNCVYSTAHLFKEPPVTVPMNVKFFEAVSERLEAMLAQMYDTSVPFRRTDDEKTCSYCDFRMICGR